LNVDDPVCRICHRNRICPSCSRCGSCMCKPVRQCVVMQFRSSLSSTSSSSKTSASSSSTQLITTKDNQS
jgi:hypothetical protein